VNPANTINIPYLDIVFLVLIVVLTIRVVVRGFVKEFLDMAALIGAAVVAIFLSGPLSLLLDKLFGKTGWNQIIAFLACFLIIYIIIKLLETAIHNLFDKLNLEKLDRALGFFLGLIESFLVVSILLLLLNWLKGFKFLNINALLAQSLIAKILLPIIIPLASSFGSSGSTFLNGIVDRLIRYV
jgi:membrane protein required for colicin V production